MTAGRCPARVSTSSTEMRKLSAMASQDRGDGVRFPSIHSETELWLTPIRLANPVMLISCRAS